MRMPETCWTVSKQQVINLKSCRILLVASDESMMMHGLANPKSFNTFKMLNPLFRHSRNAKVKHNRQTYRHSNTMKVIIFHTSESFLSL